MHQRKCYRQSDYSNYWVITPVSGFVETVSTIKGINKHTITVYHLPCNTNQASKELVQALAH